MKKITALMDCHTHSSFSNDSNISLEAAVHKARKLGLGGIVFTDHLELDHPLPEFNKNFDIALRSEQFVPIQRKYEGELKLLQGIEIGFQPHLVGTLQSVIKNHDFDQVICSTHVVDRMDEDLLFSNPSKQYVYSRYLEAIYQAVATFDDFDVIGHIGYVCRYVPYQDKSLCYDDYHDILDAILKRVIEKGKGIEVNTSGYFRKLDFPHPDFDTIKRYKELGGSIITLGSDAHSVARIGDRFDYVVQRLVDLGFSYVTYFEKRQPVFIKI
jgi:histidinol-phosphatase (PHP family)